LVRVEAAAAVAALATAVVDLATAAVDLAIALAVVGLGTETARAVAACVECFRAWMTRLRAEDAVAVRTATLAAAHVAALVVPTSRTRTIRLHAHLM
jgi:hypothetical protein